MEKSIIMSISENDALWNNSTKEEPAKYQILIDDGSEQLFKRNQLSDTGERDWFSPARFDYPGTLISYVRKLFLWTAIKIKSRKANASMALRSGISLCLMQINK
jgi:hypothetical protein